MIKKFKKFKDKVIRKVFKYLTLKVVFPHVYKSAIKKNPIVENKIVFVELRQAKITNCFEYMINLLEKNYNFEIKKHFLRLNVVRNYKYAKNAIAMLKDAANANYIFVNEASLVLSSVKLREGTKIVQLWHGCGAFKKFGFSTAESLFGDNREQMLKYPYNKNYSLVTVSSPEIVWAYEEALNYTPESKVVRATGVSRTDVFFDEDFKAKAFENLHEQMPSAKGKKVILYAPTFRGRVANAKTSNKLDISAFYEKFKDEYVILIKHHPLVRKAPKIPDMYREFAKNVTKTMSIDDLICCSDICITDYSSLVFEYSLFERPIIFFAYDIDKYYDWRGFYYDYFEDAPGPVHKTNEEMIDYISNIEQSFDKEKVVKYKYKFMRSCDGNSTMRILNTIVGEEKLESLKK